MKNLIVIPIVHPSSDYIKKCSCEKGYKEGHINPNANIKNESLNVRFDILFPILIIFMVGAAIKSALD